MSLNQYLNLKYIQGQNESEPVFEPEIQGLNESGTNKAITLYLP